MADGGCVILVTNYKIIDYRLEPTLDSKIRKPKSVSSNHIITQHTYVYQQRGPKPKHTHGYRDTGSNHLHATLKTPEKIHEINKEHVIIKHQSGWRGRGFGRVPVLMKGLEGQPRPSNHTSSLKSEMIFTFSLQSPVFWPSQGLCCKRPESYNPIDVWKQALIFNCRELRTGTSQPKCKIGFSRESSDENFPVECWGGGGHYRSWEI